MSAQSYKEFEQSMNKAMQEFNQEIKEDYERYKLKRESAWANYGSKISIARQKYEESLQ